MSENIYKKANGCENNFINCGRKIHLKIKPRLMAIDYSTIKKFFDFLNVKEGKPIPLKLKYFRKGDYEFTEEELNWESDYYADDVNFLPDNMYVNGDLYLYSPKVEELPLNLTVTRSLFVSGTKISTVPSDIQIGNDLNLESNQLEFLPDNFSVNGDLDIRDNPISILPSNLFISGNLDISNTNIEELPDDIYVNEGIYFEGTPLSRKFTSEEVHSLVNNVTKYKNNTYLQLNS